MRSIYLVRHGKPEFPGGKKCCIGWTDLPLSDEGREQMRRLRDEFAGKEIERIYASPLERCIESAQIISGGKIPVEIVEDLKEIGMGKWEALPFSEIREKYPEEYELRGKRMDSFRPPEGESFRDCQKRAYAAFRRIQKKSRGNIIILGHAGMNRTLISALEGRKLRDLMEIPQNYAGIYEHRDYIFDGLIAAAGLSSRMGDYKPLMDLGGKKVIFRELETLKEGGAREICVVTGHRAAEVRSLIEDSQVHCLYNGQYAESKMFDSVRIGLSYFAGKMKSPEGKNLDGIFFLPVDVPLFTQFTMEYEKERFKDGDGDVYSPVYEGKSGHPILIRASVIEKLLQHDGERGLKGACDRLGDRVKELEVPDRGALLDADTQEEFAVLRETLAARSIPDEDECRKLLAWFHVKEDVVRHSEAVALLADEMAEAVNRNGAGLDRRLIRAGALLHDVAREKKNHAAEGAKWLSLLGHDKTAEVVRDHMDLPPEKQNYVNESMIVYLADKRIRGDRRVTIDERFSAKRELFQNNPEALAGLERRYRCAAEAERLVREKGYLQ